MIEYLYIDKATGQIKQHVVGDHIPEEPEGIVFVEHGFMDGDKYLYNLTTGKFDVRADYVEFPEPTYRELRAMNYPRIEEQLDILYHEGYEAWRTVITEVKAKYPKTIDGTG